jgi:DNA-binding MurR/RpiR family transcriptional regulator
MSAIFAIGGKMEAKKQDHAVPAIILKLQTLRDNLSKSEQKVVDYIIESPDKVIYLSVAELAQNSDVSEPTVVRACQKIGLSGYQELKVSLAQDLVSPLQSIHEEVLEDDSVKTIADKVFQSTIHALTYTRDILRDPILEQAAQAIINARRVMIFGFGNSHAIAVDLQHKLMRLGYDATAYTDSHMAAIAAAYANEHDVGFAISHSGSSKDTVENAKLARDNGATIIAMTNIGITPLSKIADINLHTASKETKYRIVALSSRIAQIAIIDTVYTIIAMRQKSSVTGFRNVEKALENKKY